MTISVNITHVGGYEKLKVKLQDLVDGVWVDSVFEPDVLLNTQSAFKSVYTGRRIVLEEIDK